MWGDTTNHFPKWPRPLEEILNWASRCRIWATKMKGKGGGKPPSLLNQLPFRPVKRIQVFGIVQPVWPGLNDDWWVILKVKGTAGIRLHNSWPLTQQQRLTFIPETATGKQQLRSPALAPTHTHCLWERMAHTEVWIVVLNVQETELSDTRLAGPAWKAGMGRRREEQSEAQGPALGDSSFSALLIFAIWGKRNSLLPDFLTFQEKLRN